MAQLGLRSELWFLVLSLLGIFEVLFACHFEVEKEPVRKILTSESGDLGFGGLITQSPFCQHISPGFLDKDSAPSPCSPAGDL